MGGGEGWQIWLKCMTGELINMIRYRNIDSEGVKNFDQVGRRAVQTVLTSSCFPSSIICLSRSPRTMRGPAIPPKPKEGNNLERIGKRSLCSFPDVNVDGQLKTER